MGGFESGVPNRESGLALAEFRHGVLRMNAAVIMVNLIEEMVDLKVQQRTESHMKATPEVARLLVEKRYTDQKRLEHIRDELVRLLSS